MSKDKTIVAFKKATSDKNITTTLKSPIGRIGGKSKLSKEIINLFPKHNHYIEVFGWWMSVLFSKQESKLETVNDINNDLVNLFETIKYHPQTLSHYLNQLFISREIFNNIKKGIYKPKNNIGRAAFFYYLISQSFGSAGNNFAMASKSGRKPKSIYKSFIKWSQRLKFVTIENMSFDKLITKYDNNTDNFFYCDPPYYNYEKYYKSGFTKEQHILLRDTLKNIKGKFLLSYNDCEEIRELYKDFNIKSSKPIEYTLGKNASWKRKVVSELYISNYEI